MYALFQCWAGKHWNIETFVRRVTGWNKIHFSIAKTCTWDTELDEKRNSVLSPRIFRRKIVGWCSLSLLQLRGFAHSTNSERVFKLKILNGVGCAYLFWNNHAQRKFLGTKTDLTFTRGTVSWANIWSQLRLLTTKSLHSFLYFLKCHLFEAVWFWIKLYTFENFQVLPCFRKMAASSNFYCLSIFSREFFD